MESKKTKTAKNIEGEIAQIGSAINPVPVSLFGGVCPVENDGCDRKEHSLGTDDLGYARQIKNSGACLGEKTIQEMIQRFLVEKKMSKEKLAKSLGIKTRDLELLVLRKALLKTITKINLPLIRMYCRTKWVKSNGS
ncbi:MAG: hypothetical protein ACD_21C00158G0004 [uncultured bacterium]|nr:MAG: hypothetical protein ACD_21C00158G0004 [uncultured bacterium]